MVGTQYQPNLISTSQPEREAKIELSPVVWQAAENLAVGEVKRRNASLDQLLDSGAPAVSPLIAYLLATRLFDPDMEFRARIVNVLANLMRRNADGTYAAEDVRMQIITAISYFGEPGLSALLEAGIHRKEALADIEKLVKYSPDAGRYLKETARDRSNSIELRKTAILLLGQIGFLDALSELVRLRNRIETRQEGQKSMPFAPAGNTGELSLLADLQKSILALQALS